MTNTLLISGCSYGLVYSKLEPELKELFRMDNFINLSSGGSSPDRQIRVVIEWIAQNGVPAMVIFPVSHYNRFDLPIAKEFDSLHNLHFKAHWQKQWIEHAYRKNEITEIIDRSILETFIKSGALVNQIEHTVHDYLFVKLLTFQAFLEQNRIRHLIFDTGNYYEKLWMNYLSIDEKENSGYQPGMKKRDLIQNCKGIYKFFDFCSNVWMYDQINNKQNHFIEFDQKFLKTDLSLNEKATIHHNKEETLKLMQFLKKETGI